MLRIFSDAFRGVTTYQKWVIFDLFMSVAFTWLFFYVITGNGLATLFSTMFISPGVALALFLYRHESNF